MSKARSRVPRRVVVRRRALPPPSRREHLIRRRPVVRSDLPSPRLSRYGSQLLFLILSVALGFSGLNQVIVATILWVIVGLWYAIQQFIVVYKFPDVVGICKSERGILGQCWHTVVGSLKGHPGVQVPRRDLLHPEGGAAAALLLATNFLVNYLVVSFTQFGLMYAIILVLAMPSSAAFGCATKKFSYKAIWIFLLAILVALAVVVPAIWVPTPPARPPQLPR